MAVQFSKNTLFEVKNPTLLQQALNNHDLRNCDGTMASQRADTDKVVRKARKMRDASGTFKEPQIEITHATILRRILQRLQALKGEEKEAFLTQFVDKRSGGNIFYILTEMQEKSMDGNQSALIGRESQEQADQNQMSNMNNSLTSIANTMQTNSQQMTADADTQKSDQQTGLWSLLGGLGGLLVGIGILATLITGGIALAVIGGALAAGGAGTAIFGGVRLTQASAYGTDIEDSNSQITVSSTDGQVVTNNINTMNQDISMQNTNIQQLNDANSSAGSFIKTAAQDMQQVQSLGNMY